MHSRVAVFPETKVGDRFQKHRKAQLSRRRGSSDLARIRREASYPKSHRLSDAGSSPVWSTSFRSRSRWGR